jgi:ABC-type transport system involved in multi-copper enzyme maturation permease subunit
MQKPRINPLLAKELRIRMRNWRTFGMISLYLLGLGGLAVLVFLSNSYMLSSGFNSMAQVGSTLFAFLAVAQILIVIYLVPALAGNAISGEKERQTIDLLTCTQLTPFQIVTGKLTATLSTVILFIVASLPLYGFVFLLGGVSPKEVLLLYLIILVVALLVGCWSLMFSAFFRRTVAAIIASYALLILMLGGSTILFTLLTTITTLNQGTTPFFLIMAFNPLTILGWLFPDFVRDIIISINYNWFRGGFQIWHLALLVQGALAALSLWLATRAINPLKMGKRKG